MTESPAPALPEARTMRDRACVGIDVGSTNTKVMLLGLEGDSGADAVSEIACRSFPTPDSPVALRADVEAALRSLLESHPCTPSAVGIAAMAETGVPLDAAGEPVGTLLRWNSEARAGAASALVARVGAESLFAATGVPPLPKAPLLMLEALRTGDPARWSSLAAWAGAGDLVTLALTGRLVTDHTLAGRTLAYRLPAAGEPLQRGFDPGLLGELGLAPSQFPEVALPGEAAGEVTPEAAARTGLAVGTPVVVAGHDHAVGAWGAGVRRPGERVDSVGTSEALLHVPATAVDRPAAFAAGMSVTRTVRGDRETLLGGSAGGSVIAALLQGRFSGGRALDPAEVFGARRSTGRDGAAQVMALPYPLGRQCPAPDPRARIRFIDVVGRPVDPGTLSAPDLGAAVLLGLCLQLRWMSEEQQRIAGGVTSGPIRVVGAAASGNAAWMRLRADVLQEELLPVRSGEPVAAAAALLAAVRVGAAGPDVVLPTAAVSAPFPGDAHDDAFAAFLAAATTPTRA